MLRSEAQGGAESGAQAVKKTYVKKSPKLFDEEPGADIRILKKLVCGGTLFHACLVVPPPASLDDSRPCNGPKDVWSQGFLSIC